MAQNGHSHNSFTNYVAYRDPKLLGQSRIGHLELESSTIQPLSFTSGAPISDLYQVIEVGGSQIKPAGEKFPLSSVELLAPIYGRDVLAVGKNYAEHAVEFNTSGYDSSDKVDQPTHPVIFTKRATSIIASEEAIYPHDGFTETLDYEGEIGVIIGKSGFKIEEADAMEHVWGYTIINDMTARERQRDHKQFYIGKSADTLCPMGPIAVPANKLPKSLRVQTHPGDVIATGTPAGVGIGKKPPIFLKPGDVVEVSITGLGVLRNKIGEFESTNQTVDRVAKATHIHTNNLEKTCGAAVRMSLLGQDPEGYAKGCTALAGWNATVPIEQIKTSTLIITGDEDKVSPPQLCEKYAAEIKGAKVITLEGVGHWHVFEDLIGVAKAVSSVLA
ncbi:hypothetical protein H4I95_04710 [Botrytis cinerea]